MTCTNAMYYVDPVRMVCVGTSVDSLLENPKNTEWANFSIEFCGGTHLSNLKEAEDFVIVEESGIAKGIRRLTGLTRKGAFEVGYFDGSTVALYVFYGYLCECACCCIVG